MSKHDEVKAFFEDEVTSLVGSVFGFNYSPETADSVAIIPQYSDRNIREYINGDKQRQYSFAFVIVRVYSTEPVDLLNMEAMELGESFMEWVEEQDKNGNYPDFGENCKVEKMEILQDMPNLATVNAEEGLARYMIQGRILYREYAEY